jgi:hypothetical protein
MGLEGRHFVPCLASSLFFLPSVSPELFSRKEKKRVCGNLGSWGTERFSSSPPPFSLDRPAPRIRGHVRPFCNRAEKDFGRSRKFHLTRPPWDWDPLQRKPNRNKKEAVLGREKRPELSSRGKSQKSKASQSPAPKWLGQMGPGTVPVG